MNYIIESLSSGLYALIDYLTIKRIISLIIAFFLSGAIATFMSKGMVMKYFGPKANKFMSYLMASISGIVLTVCSCSVLPMFASIRKKGAGIGPAITFLFAGPALNILAISFTFSLIGFDIGLARLIGAVILSIVIGLIMYLLFRNSEVTDENEEMFNLNDNSKRTNWQNLLFFITLIGVLISGVKHWIITIILLVILGIQLIKYFDKEELKDWCKETYDLAKKIVPLFIIGVFIAGVINYIIPSEFIVKYVGDNSVSANLIAAIFGAFMYFATLTEVPIVTSFMDLGMSKSATVSLLLAGPSLSLPNMIVIGKVLGKKKTITYVLLVILFSTLAALIFGWLI